MKDFSSCAEASEALEPQSIPLSLPLLPLHAQVSLSHRQPSALLGFLGFGDKNTVMGTAQGSSSSQCFSESGDDQNYTSIKDTEVKEKLYKLSRGEQNRYEGQPKPGPQRRTQGRRRLPWAEGKAVQKAFRSPPSRVSPSTAQAGVH